MTIEWLNTWWWSWGRGVEVMSFPNDSGQRALAKISWYSGTGWEIDLLWVHILK